MDNRLLVRAGHAPAYLHGEIQGIPDIHTPIEPVPQPASCHILHDDAGYAAKLLDIEAGHDVGMHAEICPRPCGGNAASQVRVICRRLLAWGLYREFPAPVEVIDPVDSAKATRANNTPHFEEVVDYFAFTPATGGS